MSETQVCEVCGKPKSWQRWEWYGAWCGEGSSDLARGECYQIGYERARAALSAAEKERDEARDAANKNAAEGYRAWQENARLRKALERWQSAWGNGIGEEADAHESAKDLLATLELASAASEAQPPPASSVPVASSTQEGEK